MKSVANYCQNLLAVATYSVTLDELYENLDKSEQAIYQELRRLVAKKNLVNLRQGFYLIVPPLYANFGQPPLRFYVEKLFAYLEQPYYLSCFTAARFHGAQHQVYQKYYVITSRPQPEINSNGIRIKFISTTNWPKGNILNRRAEAGNFRLSDEVLTAIDLIHHQKKMGGINNVLAFVEELSEEMKPSRIEELLTWYPHESTLRRFGFLLETLNARTELIEPINDFFTSKSLYPVQLVPKAGEKIRSKTNQWNIDVNVKLDNDLW